MRLTSHHHNVIHQPPCSPSPVRVPPSENSRVRCTIAATRSNTAHKTAQRETCCAAQRHMCSNAQLQTPKTVQSIQAALYPKLERQRPSPPFHRTQQLHLSSSRGTNISFAGTRRISRQVSDVHKFVAKTLIVVRGAYDACSTWGEALIEKGS